MTSIAKRAITHTDLHINRDGVVFRGHKVIPTTSKFSRLRVKMLAVEINGTVFFVWELLSWIWYEEAMLLPRDGNFMNCSVDNTIVLPTEPGRFTRDEIIRIWYAYERERIGCWQLSEKTGLHGYAADQFLSLIKEILWAGIR
jgi:hypothetical protein